MSARRLNGGLDRYSSTNIDFYVRKRLDTRSYEAAVTRNREPYLSVGYGYAVMHLAIANEPEVAIRCDSLEEEMLGMDSKCVSVSVKKCSGSICNLGFRRQQYGFPETEIQRVDINDPGGRASLRIYIGSEFSAFVFDYTSRSICA